MEQLRTKLSTREGKTNIDNSNKYYIYLFLIPRMIIDGLNWIKKFSEKKKRNKRERESIEAISFPFKIIKKEKLFGDNERIKESQ